MVTISFISILTDILLIVLSFIMLINSILGDKNALQLKVSLIESFNFLDLKPISDIKLNRFQCPPEWEELIIDNFAGVDLGCLEIEKNFTKIYSNNTGKCLNPIKNKIGNISKKDMKLWRNNLICIKRYDKEIKIINNTCTGDFKECWKIDNYNNYLCIKKNESCPISFINFTLTNGPKITENDTILSFSDKYELHFSNSNLTLNNNHSLIILPIEFKVDKDLPCINKTRISNKTIAIDLITNIDNYGCDYKNHSNNSPELKDKTFKILDTITIKDYLETNDVWADAENYYNYFNDSSFNKIDYKNENISLYYKSYLQLNRSCNYSKIINNEDIDQLKNYQYYLLLLQLGNIIIIPIFICILSLMKNHHKYLITIIWFMKAITVAIVFSFNIYILLECEQNLNEIKNFIRLSKTEECLDKILLEGKKLEKKIKEYKTIIKYHQVFCYIYFFIFIVQLIRLIYKTIQRFINTKKTSCKSKKDSLVEKM